MRRNFYPLFFLLFVLPFSVIAQVTQSWVQRFANTTYDRASCIRTNGSSVYVLGAFNVNSSAQDIALIKYNAAGALQWVQTYNGPSNASDAPGLGKNTMVLDGAGNIYIVGISNDASTGSNDVVTIKYDPNGVRQWVAKYRRADGFPSYGRGIAVDASGNVLVTGSTVFGSNFSQYDMITIKYNAAGVEQWVRTYNGTANDGDYGGFVLTDAAGNAYVCGAASGRRVKGTLTFYTGFDYRVIKYDPNGNIVWTNGYIGSYSDEPQDCKLDAAGNLYVTGVTYDAQNSADMYTVKYDANGLQQWAARYNNVGQDYADGLAVDGSGNVYISGTSALLASTNTLFDAVAIKYDATGIRQWVVTYNGPANDFDRFNNIALDAYGAVYVSGDSKGTLDDYATVKFSSTGGRLWVARYNGPANSYDDPVSMAVYTDPGPFATNAVIYVTGTSWGIGTERDIATVKYTQPTVIGGFKTASASPVRDVSEKQHVFSISNYPNPFRSATRIEYSLPEDSKVSINLYDVTGKQVASIVEGRRSAGIHQEYYTAHVSKGAYTYRIVAESSSGRREQSRQMIVQ